MRFNRGTSFSVDDDDETIVVGQDEDALRTRIVMTETWEHIALSLKGPAAHFTSAIDPRV
jgi:hypothetical protein